MGAKETMVGGGGGALRFPFHRREKLSRLEGTQRIRLAGSSKKKKWKIMGRGKRRPFEGG